MLAAAPRRRWLDRVRLEREDLVAIPLCAMWAVGVVQLAAQTFAVFQAVQPAAVELTLRAGQSPWSAMLRLPMVVVRNYFGW